MAEEHDMVVKYEFQVIKPLHLAGWVRKTPPGSSVQIIPIMFGLRVLVVWISIEWEKVT